MIYVQMPSKWVEIKKWNGLAEYSQCAIEPEVIIQTVCDFYKVSAMAMTTKLRFRKYVQPRQVSFLLIRKYTSLPFQTIGKMFGARDHTTVIHGINQIKELMDVYPNIKKDVETLSSIIYSKQTVTN